MMRLHQDLSVETKTGGYQKDYKLQKKGRIPLSNRINQLAWMESFRGFLGMAGNPETTSHTHP